MFRGTNRPAWLVTEPLELRVLLAGVPVATGVPALSSFPSAPAYLYLDFNGSTKYRPEVSLENQTYDLDGDPTTFSPFEVQVITEIWSHVADAFSPFNLNVTTVDPGANNIGLKTFNVLIGGPQEPGRPPGWANFGGFSSGFTNFAVVYNSPPVTAAETATHEAGHGFSLHHQATFDDSGNISAEYRFESGPVGPIMGAGAIGRNLWSDGPGAFLPKLKQDDMAIIAGTRNRFGYRADDHGDTAAAATSIPITNGAGVASGVLHYHTDQDWFTFNWPGGPLSITAEGSPYGPQLLSTLQLSDGSGTVLSTAIGEQAWKMIRANLGAGTYRLRVTSTEYTDSLGTRAYGNVGQYTLRIKAGALAEAQVPYLLQPFAITSTGPTTIEAEDFDRGGEGISYQTRLNGYGQTPHRGNDGVLVFGVPLEDGYVVGSGGFNEGDWIEYTISVQQPGAYDLAARLSSTEPGGRVHAEVDGVAVTDSVAVPVPWQTTPLSRVTLTSGQHVLRFVADANTVNGYPTGDVNWLRFTPASTTPATPIAPCAAADAYVRDGTYAGQNFGTSSELQLKKSGTGSNRELYLKFDLTSFSSVATAKMRLFGRIDSSSERPSVALYSASNTTWSETGITWNNRPAAGAIALATTTVATSSQKYYEWDVTSFLQAQKAAGATAVTLVLRSLTTTTPHMIFSSDDTAANRPELLVTPSGTQPPPPQPGVSTLRAAADAHVRDGSSAGLNFGTTTELQLKKNATGSNREIFLKFDLSSFTSVNNAKLRLFGRIDSANEQPSIGVFSAASTSWTESSLTWTNRPAASITALATVTVATSTPKWYEWDVTSYLQAQKTAGATFATLVLRSLTTTTPHMIFSSDEAATNRPELVVTS